MNEQKKILIVDEDHLMLFGLSKALRQKDLEVATAATARQALHALNENQFDMCMLNIHLPDANGLELMETIWNHSPRTVITLMTANYIDDLALRDDITKAMATGACHFLAKPFNLVEATDLIMKALEGKIDEKDGFQLTAEGYMDKKRRHRRKPFVKVLKYQMEMIDKGEIKRTSLRAVSTDICDGGVGLLTQTPLKMSQIISFDEDLYSKIGVVVWSIMLNDLTCRAGVKFT